MNTVDATPEESSINTEGLNPEEQDSLKDLGVGTEDLTKALENVFSSEEKINDGKE